MNNDSIYISKSKIISAGKGVFSKKYIKKGVKLGEYQGIYYLVNDNLDEIYDDIYKNSGTDEYVMLITDKKGKEYAIIDGARNGNWVRFINGAKTKEQFPLINCEFYQYNKKMFLKSTKSIEKNEELIIDYGSRYVWN